MIRSSSLCGSEESEMNILIIVIWTNIEDRQRNIKWILFDELLTARDVDEANAMVRLKNN